MNTLRKYCLLTPHCKCSWSSAGIIKSKGVKYPQTIFFSLFPTLSPPLFLFPLISRYISSSLYILPYLLPTKIQTYLNTHEEAYKHTLIYTRLYVHFHIQCLTQGRSRTNTLFTCIHVNTQTHAQPPIHTHAYKHTLTITNTHTNVKNLSFRVLEI